MKRNNTNTHLSQFIGKISYHSSNSRDISKNTFLDCDFHLRRKSKPQGRKAHQRFSAMEEIRIVLLGFGSANRALVEMLCSKSELLGRQRSLRINRSGKSQLIPWRVVSIVTGRHGAVCIPTETDLIYEVNLQKANFGSNQ